MRLFDRPLAPLGHRIQRWAAELRRRRVWRVSAVYLAGAFVLWQVADVAAPALGLPRWLLTALVWGTIVGLPVVIALAWLFDVSPEGIERTAPTRALAQPEAAEPSRPLVPARPGPLVGRGPELQTIEKWLADPMVRLISVVGAGGVGKTRLVLEAAHRLADGPGGDATPHRVRFIALGDSVGTDFLLALTSALGIRAPAPSLGAVAGVVEDVEVLVCDGVPATESAGAVIAELLDAAPHLTLLITTGSRLALRAEYVLSLDGLPSSPDGSGVELFIEMARRGAPEFAPSVQDRAVMGRICDAVDGLPLAIELVAGWADLMSPAEILREVEQGRHLFSESPHTDTPDRHRSLTMVAGAALERLPERSRRLARRLAVFRGAFTLEAARAVAGDDATPDLLRALARSSILHLAGPRFRMQRIVAEYARREWGRSGSDDPGKLVERHARWFLERVRSGLPVEDLPTELPDIQAAWAHAWERRPSDAAAMLGPLFDVCDRSGCLGVLEAAIDGVLPRSTTGGPEDARARIIRARARHRLGRLADAVTDLVDGLDGLPRDAPPTERAIAVNALGDVMASLGRYDDAERFCREALRLFKEAGNGGGVAATLMNLGVIAQSRHDLEEARGLHAEALELAQQVGDRRTVAQALVNLGAVAHDLGDLDEARSLYARSLAAAETVDDGATAAAALANLGRVSYRQGDEREARAWSEDAERRFTAAGDELGRVAALLNLGDIALAGGEETRAEALFFSALVTAVQKDAQPLVGEALLGVAELHHRRGRTEEAAALVAPTLGCVELDPEAAVRRDRLATELDVQDHGTSLRAVALSLLESRNGETNGQGTSLQAHRARSGV